MLKGYCNCYFFKKRNCPIFDKSFIALIEVKILLCFSLKQKRLQRRAGLATNNY